MGFLTSWASYNLAYDLTYHLAYHLAYRLAYDLAYHLAYRLAQHVPGYMTVSAGLHDHVCRVTMFDYSRELNLLNCSCRLIICRVINETPNPSQVTSQPGHTAGYIPDISPQFNLDLSMLN